MAGTGHWTTDATWQDMVSSLRSLPGGLRYAELCGGIGAPTFAIKALDIPAQLIGHWDTETRYATFLRKFSDDHDKLFLGEEGDVVNMDTAMLRSCHFIVSGPPCPPWSNIGLRGGDKDIRSCVFWAVCGHIINAARCGVLIFFVLENVPGLDTRGSGQSFSETPAMQLIDYLEEGLGSGWRIEKTVMNTSDFGLPQRRRRLYITGRRLANYPEGCPSPCPVFQQPGHSSDVLDMSEKESAREFTAKQSANIMDYKRLHRSFMMNEIHRGKVAFVDHSRSPTNRTKWGRRGGQPTRLHADLCETLTASGPAMYVFSLGEGMGTGCVFGKGPLTVDRELLGHERGALQGFPAEACRFFGHKGISKLAFGNAMSVPVVGMAIARELSALLKQNGPAALQKMFESGSGHHPQPQPPAMRSIFIEESDREDNMDVQPDKAPKLA
jgi:DNA-cytosine methyltransferase